MVRRTVGDAGPYRKGAVWRLLRFHQSTDKPQFERFKPPHRPQLEGYKATPTHNAIVGVDRGRVSVGPAARRGGGGRTMKRDIPRSAGSALLSSAKGEECVLMRGSHWLPPGGGSRGAGGGECVKRRFLGVLFLHFFRNTALFLTVIVCTARLLPSAYGSHLPLGGRLIIPPFTHLQSPPTGSPLSVIRLER